MDTAEPTPPTAGPSLSPEREANKLKFELELETIQALSNPHYLLELSSTGYLDSGSFLNFVTYLEYWEKPEYAKFLIYPQALHHRRLLLLAPFRQALRTNGPELVSKLSDGQFEHWKSWRSEKPKETAAAAVEGTEDSKAGIAA